MKIVLIDLDGPLADFETEFLKIWRDRFPNEFFLPFEERTQFYLENDYPDNLKDKIRSIKNESGFFASLQPTKNSIYAVKKIVEMGFEVFICSTGIYDNKNCLTEKKQWVEKYLGEDLAKTAIFTKDKTVIRGDYLIDDRPNIKGVVIPEWQHVIFDQPFNGEVKNLPRIKIDWSNWEEIILP